MAYHVELQIAAKTDTGLVRSHNEDSIAHSREHGLAILADGMGGYNAGEVASAIATSTIKEMVEAQMQAHAWDARSNHSKYIQQLLIGSVERANDAIIRGNAWPGFHRRSLGSQRRHPTCLTRLDVKSSRSLAKGRSPMSRPAAVKARSNYRCQPPHRS